MVCSFDDIASFKNVPCSATILAVSNVVLIAFYLEWSILSIASYVLIASLIGGFAYSKFPIPGLGECKPEAWIEEFFSMLKDFTLSLVPQIKFLLCWNDPYLSLYVLVGSYVFLYFSDFFNLIVIAWIAVNAFFIYGAKKKEVDALLKPHLDKACVQLKDVLSKIPRAAATEEKKST